MIAGTQTWADEPKPTSKPTGKTYCITSLDDFLKVPDDRLPRCLAEFSVMLLMAGKEKSILAPKGQAVLLNKFEWKDDGLDTRAEMTYTPLSWWKIIGMVVRFFAIVILPPLVVGIFIGLRWGR